MNHRPMTLASLLVLLTACAGASRNNDLNDTMSNYANVMRWMDIEAALSFINPDEREDAMPTQLELSRWANFRVSGYRETPVQMVGDYEAHQQVEIRLINRHTMAEKVVRDYQVWTWDKEAKRWWLSSGLADISGSAH